MLSWLGTRVWGAFWVCAFLPGGGWSFVAANSDWAIDHDDASSWFEDSKNVMVYGSHKWRDGVHKW